MGIVRVLDKEVADLKPLPPGYQSKGDSATPMSVCPADAPVKSFNVVALDRPMKLNPKAPDVIEVDFERKIEMTNPGRQDLRAGRRSREGSGQRDAESAHAARQLRRLSQGPV